MSEEIGRLIRLLIQQESEKLFVPELKAAREEIARRTLTDAEREAIKEAAAAYEQNNGDPDCERIADTLHGLLDRLGGT